MKLIVGLGNPGREYANTRHNVGFRVVDELARRWQVAVSRRAFSGRTGGGSIAGQAVLLLKPATYMNLSGRAVREAMTFHKLALPDLLVVADDLALPLARLRIRPCGSPGGHKGLGSIAAELASEDFARLRVGIEWVAGSQAVQHVLGAFFPEEEQQMQRAVARAADAVESWLTSGVEPTMNQFNGPEESSE